MVYSMTTDIKTRLKPSFLRTEPIRNNYSCFSPSNSFTCLTSHSFQPLRVCHCNSISLAIPQCQRRARFTTATEEFFLLFSASGYPRYSLRNGKTWWWYPTGLLCWRWEVKPTRYAWSILSSASQTEVNARILSTLRHASTCCGAARAHIPAVTQHKLHITWSAVSSSTHERKHRIRGKRVGGI